MARPDGTLEYNPGALTDKRAMIVNGVDLVTAHFSLLQEAKERH